MTDKTTSQAAQSQSFHAEEHDNGSSISGPPPIDYRGLLLRYMVLVMREKSISFLDRAEIGKEFSAAEIGVLCSIEGQARNIISGA